MSQPEDASRSGWLAAVQVLDRAGWPELLYSILRSLRHDLVGRLTGLNLLRRLAESERGRPLVGEGLGEAGESLAILARQLEYIVQPTEPRIMPLDPAEVLRGALLVHASVAQVPLERHRMEVDGETPAVRWDRTLMVRSILLAMDSVGRGGDPLVLELGVSRGGAARLTVRAACACGAVQKPLQEAERRAFRVRARLLGEVYHGEGGRLRSAIREGGPLVQMEFPRGIPAAPALKAGAGAV